MLKKLILLKASLNFNIFDQNLNMEKQTRVALVFIIENSTKLTDQLIKNQLNPLYQKIK